MHDAKVSSSARWHASTLAAASLAGFTADSVMYPADALSTHAQARQVPSGLGALYRGFWAAAILGAPAYAVYLGTYDYAYEVRGIPPAAAGAMAELAGGMVFVPVEVLKRRAALGQPGYAPLQMPGTVARLIREHGIRALYKGYFASSATWIPFSTIYFASFERVRKIHAVSESPFRDLIAGASGGAIAASATAPLDLVATRVQTKHNGASGVVDVLRGVIREDPRIVPTLFRAAPARMLWLAPQTAIYMAVFQHLKQRFNVSTTNANTD